LRGEREGLTRGGQLDSIDMGQYKDAMRAAGFEALLAVAHLEESDLGFCALKGHVRLLLAASRALQRSLQRHEPAADSHVEDSAAGACKQLYEKAEQLARTGDSLGACAARVAWRLALGLSPLGRAVVADVDGDFCWVGLVGFRGTEAAAGLTADWRRPGTRPRWRACRGRATWARCWRALWTLACCRGPPPRPAACSSSRPSPVPCPLARGLGVGGSANPGMGRWEQALQTFSGAYLCGPMSAAALSLYAAGGRRDGVVVERSGQEEDQVAWVVAGGRAVPEARVVGSAAQALEACPGELRQRVKRGGVVVRGVSGRCVGGWAGAADRTPAGTCRG
jgi:hypothetical protein